MMAQGGGNQPTYIHIPITVKVDSSLLQSTVREGDHYGDQIRTNIIDSNIGEVVAGAAQPTHDVKQPDPDGAQHGPDEPPDDQDDNDVNVAEEMQQMNLATNHSTLQKKPIPGARGTKSKIALFESVLKKSQKSEKDETIEIEGSRTLSSFTQTPTVSSSSSLTQTTPAPTSSSSTQTPTVSSSSSFTQTTTPSTGSSFAQTLPASTVTHGTQAGATTENVSGASGSQTASTVRKAKVAFDYDAQKDDELDLKVGDVITEVEGEDVGWCTGLLNGKRGVFHGNFVEMLKEKEEKKAPLPPSANKKPKNVKLFKVKFEYQANFVDELSLAVGDIIKVLLKDVEDGWAQGLKQDGKKGVFPTNFGEMLEGWSDPEENVADRKKNISTASSKTTTAKDPSKETTPMKPKKSEQIDEKTKMKIAYLRGRCSAFMENPKRYKKAAEFLENVTKLQHESDFYTMLQLAECYLHLGKNGEANETIGKVRSLIMTSQTLCANDVKVLAEDLAANSAHTRAMILFPIACDMFHANASSPDDAVNRMYECIEQMCLSVEALVNDSGKPRQIAASGIRYQEQMYESLSSVKNAKPGYKVLQQAWAVVNIGFNYDSVGEHENELKLSLSGVELLQQHFKGKESMYRVYGQLLNNIGFAHNNLGNFTEAEKYYVKSVDAKTEATDYPSESKKQEDIEFTKNNLKKTREILVKK